MQHHKNNFDFLRFLFASFVIISHSYALVGQGDNEPLRRLTHALVFSGIGVSGFFVLSGYLIYQSVLNSSSVFSFAEKRVRRIFPALFTVVFLSAFLLGPLLTELKIADYFSDKNTYGYWLANSFLLPVKPTLPGVFTQNFMPEVNGSLWTLRYELLCYVAMIGLFFVVVKKHKTLVWLVFISLVLGNSIVTYFPSFFQKNIHYHLSNLFSLCTYFCFGVLLSCYKEKWLPHKKVIAIFAVLFLFFIVFVSPDLIRHIWIFVYPALALSLGNMYSPYLQIGKKIGDISYGTYIYAFPIQQALISILDLKNPVTLMLLSFPLSWLAGWLSFHFVEKKFLKRK